MSDKKTDTYRVVKGIEFGGERFEPGTLLAEADLPKGQKTWLMDVGAIEIPQASVDLTQPAKDVVSDLSEVEYADELRQLRDLEQAGSKRKTVLEAIDKNLADLDPPANETTDTQEG